MELDGPPTQILIRTRGGAAACSDRRFANSIGATALRGGRIKAPCATSLQSLGSRTALGTLPTAPRYQVRMGRAAPETNVLRISGRQFLSFSNTSGKSRCDPFPPRPSKNLLRLDQARHLAAPPPPPRLRDTARRNGRCQSLLPTSPLAGSIELRYPK